MARDEILRAVMTALTKRVVRADKSPMNAKRWCCELECGHETWVTRSSKPKRAACDKCKPVATVSDVVTAIGIERDRAATFALCAEKRGQQIAELTTRLTAETAAREAAEKRLAKSETAWKSMVDENHRNANKAAHLGSAVEVIAHHVGVTLPPFAERKSGWANPVWEATKTLAAERDAATRLAEEQRGRAERVEAALASHKGSLCVVYQAVQAALAATPPPPAEVGPVPPPPSAEAEAQRSLNRIAAIRRGQECTRPPLGWTCSREFNHEGPCAARPTGQGPSFAHAAGVEYRPPYGSMTSGAGNPFAEHGAHSKTIAGAGGCLAPQRNGVMSQVFACRSFWARLRGPCLRGRALCLQRAPSRRCAARRGRWAVKAGAEIDAYAAALRTCDAAKAPR